jgi:hypothetical protein
MLKLLPEAVNMASLNLNLSDELKARAEARAAESGFGSVEQYVEQLVRADAGGDSGYDEELEKVLLSRLDGGPGIEVDAEDFRRMREKFQARLDSTSESKP